jgi:hypothetical protein
MNKDEIKALKMDLLDYGMVSEIFPEYISTEGLSKITKKVDTINKYLFAKSGIVYKSSKYII